MKQFAFGKQEKLCSQKVIETLFTGGNSFLVYPVKTVWTVLPSGESRVPLQVAFSVPKRLFKRAHDRNHLKRLMRESYRLNKQQINSFCNEKNLQIAVMMVYIAKEQHDFNKLNGAMVQTLARLMAQIGKSLKAGEQLTAE